MALFNNDELNALKCDLLSKKVNYLINRNIQAGRETTKIIEDLKQLLDNYNDKEI